MGEGDDERREAAISSTPSLQPNFDNKSISQHQLRKLQELHKRRLKLKSKFHNESKGRTIRSHVKHCKNGDGEISDRNVEDLLTNLKNQRDITDFSSQQANVTADDAPKKRQKLHWGLDTKERWERKANM
ncbi:uncharacterized protein LOC126677290 [Mercurialis annua]|uniref:uncharacterized protein LOC126677290 n=1 Tax=Mercurialis annua TaxID=3986 RepID=UPI00215E518D|nr:uncharacterized protein LOC126677290 [Mercurialis annua]